MDWWAFLFGFRGRINRAKCWLALFILFIVARCGYFLRYSGQELLVVRSSVPL